MKNTTKLFGIITFVVLIMVSLVFGMTVVGCDNDTTNDSGNSIPNVPTGISASANSSSSITITWNTVSGASEYRIYRSSSSSGSFNQVGSAVLTSYTNTGLSANTTYYYRITAYTSSGESSQSTTTSATTSSGTGGGIVNPFVGTWKTNTGYPYQLVFKANLTVVANWAPLASDNNITYRFSGNTATITTSRL